MLLNTFINQVRRDLHNFKENMKNLEVKNETQEEWIQTFLNWKGWETEEK